VDSAAIDMDATLVTCHSDKAGAAGNLRGGYGFHRWPPLGRLPTPLSDRVVVTHEGGGLRSPVLHQHGVAAAGCTPNPVPPASHVPLELDTDGGPTNGSSASVQVWGEAMLHGRAPTFPARTRQLTPQACGRVEMLHSTRLSSGSRRRNAIVGSALLIATTLGIVQPSTASAASPTMVGAATSDRGWLSANVGPVESYRVYSPTLPSTWSSGLSRPGPVDYSFNLDPQAVPNSRGRIESFVATTPKNLIINYWHEPEVEISPTDFRSATRIVADIVHAQNRADGGTRRVEIILMGWTFRPQSGRNPMDWWPGRDSAGRNYVDIVSVDVYSDPQGPNTANGYTNGVNWRSASQLFDPTIEFAAKVGARWSVSEFGYLEDSTKPGHKATAISDAIDYAIARNAVAVQYWDSIGRRGDWRLRHSTSATNAFAQAVREG